jgi:hypothetical protein
MEGFNFLVKKIIAYMFATSLIPFLIACQTVDPASAKHFQVKAPIHNLSQKKRCGC